MKSLKANFVFYALRIGLSFLYPLISLPYVTRVLGPENLGKVGLATSTVALLSLLAAFGIPFYAVREIARHRDDDESLRRTAGELFILGLLTTALAYAVFIACLFFIPRFSADKPVFLIASTTMLLSAIGMEWLYQAEERFGYIALRTVAFNAAALAGLFLFVRDADDYYVYAALLALAAGGADAVNFLLARRRIDLSGFRLKALAKHLRPVLILFGMNIARGFYSNADAVLLGLVKGDLEVGLYSTAQKFIRIILMVIASAGTVLLPRLAYYAGRAKTDAMESLAERALRFVLLLAMPAAAGLALVSGDLINVVAGDRFAGSAGVLAALSFVVVLNSINYFIAMQVLLPLGQEKDIAIGSGIGAAVNVIALALTVPTYGAPGAAGAMVATEIVVTAYMLMRSPSFVLRTLFSTGTAKIALGVLLIALADYPIRMLFTQSAITRLLMQVTLSSLVYIVALVATREETAMSLGRWAGQRLGSIYRHGVKKNK